MATPAPKGHKFSDVQGLSGVRGAAGAFFMCVGGNGLATWGEAWHTLGMMRFASAVCVLLAASAAQAQMWTAIGPAPITNFSGASGRVAAVVCSPTDANKWFIGACDGGVWRTTDAGMTWTPLTDGLPTTAIGALALDPTNENVIYAGSGEGNFANHSRYGLGMYKSVDGGATWVVLGAATFSGRSFGRILVHPTNPQRVFAAVVGAGGGPERFGAKRHPQRTGARGVFVSADGGVTWMPVAGGLPAVDATDLEFDPVDPAVMYAGIGHVYGDAANGIYKSSDGGATWARLGGGIPEGTGGRVDVHVARSNRERVYANFAIVSGGIGVGGSSVSGGGQLGGFVSVNGGATWGTMSVPSGLGASQQFYNNLITVSPTVETTVFVGGVNVVRSDNAGGTFTGNLPGHHPDYHAADWDASGRLVVGNDGGIGLSSDLGATFQSRNAGLQTLQFYAGLSTHPTDDTIVYGGMQDNGTARRSDPNSRTWTSVFGGDGGWTQIDQRDPARIFVEFQGAGNLFRSTNNGQGFPRATSSIGGRHAFLPPFLIDATDSQRMLYATERVWESLDGGSTFVPVSADLTSGSPFAIRALAMSRTEPRFVYAVTNDHRVLASEDFGRTFVTRATEHYGWPRVTREVTVDRDDPRTVYVAGATFGAAHVRRSRDGGATFETLDGDLPDVPVQVIEADDRWITPRLYAGADDGVYMSRDGGAHWVRLGVEFPHVAVIDLILEPTRMATPGRGRLIAATQGRGAWLMPVFAPTDFNEDGVTDPDDLADYIGAFFGMGGAGADFNGDGLVDPDDLADYIGAFFG